MKVEELFNQRFGHLIKDKHDKSVKMFDYWDMVNFAESFQQDDKPEVGEDTIIYVESTDSDGVFFEANDGEISGVRLKRINVRSTSIYGKVVQGSKLSTPSEAKKVVTIDEIEDAVVYVEQNSEATARLTAKAIATLYDAPDDEGKDDEGMTALTDKDMFQYANEQLQSGRDYLMQVESNAITVEDALEAFGFGRNGLLTPPPKKQV